MDKITKLDDSRISIETTTVKEVDIRELKARRAQIKELIRNFEGLYAEELAQLNAQIVEAKALGVADSDVED
jgi:hypothetical protein